MRLPAVVPMKDYPLDGLLQELDRLKTDLNNKVTSGTAEQLLDEYGYWSNNAAAALANIFSYDDVERLTLTPRHWHLMSVVLRPSNERAVHATLRAERMDRDRALTTLQDELRAIQVASAELPRCLIAADTNIYLHCKEKFWNIDWPAVAGDPNVRLLVPVAVFRELDRAKRTPGNKKVVYDGDELVRDRARVTSRELRQRLPKPDTIGKVAEGVTVELVLDGPAHRPIVDADSEIIDRLAAAQRLLGRKISVYTDDGNMEYGAEVAGLGAIRCSS